jgi:hypothetical protein
MGDGVDYNGGRELSSQKLAPRCGRVSNFRGVPVTGDQGGLRADSDAYGFVISAVGFRRNPTSALSNIRDPLEALSG